MVVYRLLAGAMVMFGAAVSLNMVWSLADLTMAMMTLCNLVAIVLLGRKAIVLLEDYRRQKRQGRNPEFRREDVAGEIDTGNIECW